MRARRVTVRQLTCLSAALLGLAISSAPEPAAAAVTPVARGITPGSHGDHALKHDGVTVAEASPTAACMAPQATPQERADACTALIESDSADNRTLAVAHCNRGRALSMLKQYDRALDDLNEAIRREPSYSIAFNARGQLLARKHDTQGAIADFTRAIEIDPTSPAPYLHRGAVFFELREFDRTISDATEVIKRDPKNIDAWFLRAQAYVKLKNADAVIADLTEAIALAPKSAQLRIARAYSHLERKDSAHAIEDFTAAIAIQPRDITYAARGNVFEQMHAREEAIADYQKALELNPELDVARSALGRLGGEPPANAALPPGDCISNDAPLESRIAGCRAAIAGGTLTGWTLKTAHCNLGYWLTDAQQYDRVIEASDAALKVDPKWACAYLNRGRGWYYKHDLDRALADYNETLRLDPKFHEAYANRGTVHFDRKEFAEAIADYDRAIAIEAV